MTDIEINAKSDRELLIMLVDKQNTVCTLVEKHDRWINGGDTIPGARFQVYILWIVFIGILVKIF